MKKVVKINENTLKQIVSESIKKVLNESVPKSRIGEPFSFCGYVWGTENPESVCVYGTIKSEGYKYVELVDGSVNIKDELPRKFKHGKLTVLGNEYFEILYDKDGNGDYQVTRITTGQRIVPKKPKEGPRW